MSHFKEAKALSQTATPKSLSKGTAGTQSLRQCPSDENQSHQRTHGNREHEALSMDCL